MASPPDKLARPDTERELVVGSLCTGYGGLDLGMLAALGTGRIGWVADSDPHVARILAARMPGIPNLGDVRHIDWISVEPVDVVVVGFPCQDISAAGRRAGIEKGTRSGLWTDIVAGLRVLRPAFVVVENVAALRWRNGGLHRVLGDLAEAGYDALWRSVRASDIGAAHRRERVFLLAWPRDAARADAADTTGTRRRPSRTGGPSTPSCTGASGQLARRRACLRLLTTSCAAADPDSFGREQQHPPNPHWRAVALRPSAAPADPDGRGLEVCRDPDSASAEASDSGGFCDADRLRAAAADTACDRHRHSGSESGTRVPAAVVATGAAARRRRGDRLRGVPTRGFLVAFPDLDAPPVQPRCHPESPPSQAVNWGTYEAAIRRWERVLGRPVPHPTQSGRHGRRVLDPGFVEHLMGLPAGWVTDLPLPRTAQLRVLGNGVVWQQAAHAVSLLLADLADLLHICERSAHGHEEAA